MVVKLPVIYVGGKLPVSYRGVCQMTQTGPFASSGPGIKRGGTVIRTKYLSSNLIITQRIFLGYQVCDFCV